MEEILEKIEGNIRNISEKIEVNKSEDKIERNIREDWRIGRLEETLKKIGGNMREDWRKYERRLEEI